MNHKQQLQPSEAGVTYCNETGVGKATGAGETQVCLGIIPVKV